MHNVSDIKECQHCGCLKNSNPTPDGDEICTNCGDKEMMDFEMVLPEEINKEEFYKSLSCLITIGFKLI